jgi:ribosomal protein L11 methyltransferase
VPWQQLIVRVLGDSVPAVESLLEAAGAQAVSLVDAANTPVLEPDPGEAPLWPEVAVKALFPADCDLHRLRRVLTSALGESAAVEIESLPDEGWRESGQERIPPRRFGSRLWVVSAGDPEPVAGAICVRLHMGFAFGTGGHPTTALCLDWIDSELEVGSRVLDFGCGSGVLALAALGLGASAAWATDNDPQARIATASNAALNSAGRRLWIGPPEALPSAVADVVLANILARPLIERAAYFAERLPSGGRVVLSGILQEQGDNVLAAYDPYFEDFSVAERDGWLRISALRRAVTGVRA